MIEIFYFILLVTFKIFQALTFYKCNNLKVKDLKIENAQQIHLLIEKCVGVEVTKLVVTSPENSPNTDGIHITSTQNIQISDSTIATGIDKLTILIFIYL